MKIWLIGVPLPGHILPLISIAQKLSYHGHHAIVISAERVRSVVTPFCNEDQKQPSDGVVSFMSLGEINESPHWHREVEPAVSEMNDFGNSTQLTWTWFISMWKHMFVVLKNRLEQVEKSPDVIVSDLFTYAGFDIAEILQIPLIVNNPCLLPVLSPKLLPMYDLVPSLLMYTRKGKVSWIQKNLVLPIVRFISKIYIQNTFEATLNQERQKLNLKKISLFELPSNEVPILVNSYWGIEYARPITPLIHMVGPLVPHLKMSILNRNQSLEKKVQDFLDSADRVVYISMGTLATLQNSVLSNFREALLQFSSTNNVKVLWKSREMPEEGDIHDPLMILPWVPSQTALLESKKVVCFVSHCGINSSHESLYYGKPLLCVPMFGDQLDMGQRVEDAEAGLMISKLQLANIDLVVKRLTEIVSNEKYRVKARKISVFLQGSGGTVEAIRLIEMYAKIGSFGVPDMACRL